MQPDLARGGDDALGNHLAADDAAEDIDQHALDMRVGENEPEGRRHTLGRGPAADIEEVGGGPAMQAYAVHGGHGETRAVGEAPDRALRRR